MIPPIETAELFLKAIAALPVPEQTRALEMRICRLMAEKNQFQHDLEEEQAGHDVPITIPPSRIPKALGREIPDITMLLEYAIGEVMKDIQVLSERVPKPNDLLEIFREMEEALHSQNSGLIHSFLEHCFRFHNLPLLYELLHTLPARIMNASDSQGFTPLTRAIFENNPEKIIFLHAIGVNMNTPGTRGIAPLAEALFNNKEHLIDLLESLGADIDAPDDGGLNQLAKALLKNTEQIPMLTSFGASRQKARCLIQAKILAAVWGLKGRVSHRDSQGHVYSFELCGFPQKNMGYFFVDSIKKFFLHSPSFVEKPISDLIIDTIEQGIITPQSTEELTSRIRENRPTLFLTGWPEHGVSVLFGNNKLYICNRGEACTKHAIEAYICPSDSVTEELVEFLRKHHESADSFYALFRSTPWCHQHLDQEGIDLQFQKTGNCSWANMKIIFLVLLFILREKAIPNRQKRLESCYALYKHYSLEQRIIIARKYLHNALHYFVPEILLQLTKKIEHNNALSSEIKTELIEKIATAFQKKREETE